MVTKVKGNGVRLPRSLLGRAKRVEIRRERGGRLVVTPLPERDPVADLGRNPVSCGITDASTNHDAYLYGAAK